MKITYLSIQRVTGLIRLPDDANHDLLLSDSRQVRAFLTMSREPYYLHLRRCSAYSIMIARMLVENMHSPLAAPERFAAALSAITISEPLKEDRPLLVVESTSTVETLTPGRLNDMQTCGIGLGLFDQVTVAKLAKTAIEAAISGIALTLPLGTTPNVESVGTVAYATEPDSNRPLYSIEPSASASMTSMTSIDADSLNEASVMTHNLYDNRILQTVAHLLSRSLQTTDDLQAFLTAWAGLEVFLDKVFENYKKEIFTQMKAGIAQSAGPLVDRLQNVIETSARYNVRDKFTVVSSFLIKGDTKEDMALFFSLKETRDRIHVMALRPHGYPTLKMQNLLRKYLRLYLTRDA